MTKPLAIKPLKTRPQYLAVAQTGHKAVKSTLVVQYLPPEGPGKEALVGLTVSTRAGNAVKRSRIKRRLREAIKAVVPDYGLAGARYVVIARPRALSADFENLKKDLQSALTSLHSKQPNKESG